MVKKLQEGVAGVPRARVAAPSFFTGKRVSSLRKIPACPLLRGWLMSTATKKEDRQDGCNTT